VSLVTAASTAPHVGDPRAIYPIESHKAPLSALALHQSLPLLASGSRSQFIKVFDLGASRELTTIRYFDGFLGARIGPISCLAFHPTKPLLAAGSTDSVLALYSA